MADKKYIQLMKGLGLEKKTILLVSIIFVGSVFGYTQQDIAHATLLGQKTIVTSQINPDKYRLDDRAIRQEVIGMALKLKGIQLPAQYACKGYFVDVTGDTWVCRAIEIAADNGIITRANSKARPSDFITPEEATAIFMNARGITYPKNVQIPGVVYYQGKSQWIIDLDVGLIPLGIEMPYSDTRADIFHVAYQISIFENGLKFIDGSESDNGNARIYIGQKEFDITSVVMSDRLGTGLGRLFFRSGNKVYAQLGGDIGWSYLVELDLDNMKTRQLGLNPFISANGQLLTFWNNSDDTRVLSILDTTTGIETKHTFLDMRGLIGSQKFSDDYTIFQVSTSEYGDGASWLHTLNRTHGTITKKTLTQ